MAHVEQFPERNAEIIRRREAGEYPTEIAKAMGLSRNAVIGCLNRAGKCSPNVDRSEVGRLFSARGETNANSKLTDSAVRDIRANAGRGNSADLAERHGVSIKTVYDVLQGRSWKHVA